MKKYKKIERKREKIHIELDITKIKTPNGLY